MKILVTGGAGYIGSHAVTRLLAQGHEVIVYDNLSSGFREAVPSGATFVMGDVRDESLLTRVLRDHRIDAVMHFAAKLNVAESLRLPWDYYDTNVVGGLRTIQAALQAGVRHFVFSSTAAVYGDCGRPARENDEPSPMTPYGTSKRMVEQILEDIGRTQDQMSWISLRYFNVAGAAICGTNGQRTRNASHLVKAVAEAAVGRRSDLHIYGDDYPTKDGTCVRDFIHVEDLVNAHLYGLEALAAGKVRNQIYNCGYGHGVSVQDVVATMKRVSGQNFSVKRAERRHGDPARVVADVSKIRRELGWTPRYDSLEMICKSAYDWEIKLPPGR